MQATLSYKQLNVGQEKCLDLKYLRVISRELIIKAVEANEILRERPER